MALQIKSLFKGVVPVHATDDQDIYPVPVNKTAIVKSIRLVNTGTAPVAINLFVRRATGGTSYRIVPKDLTLAPGAAFVDETEITLEGLTAANGEDRIRGRVPTGSTVDCVVSGVERDA
jgi:hypothetical protein